jgi:hypothetical protein
MTQPMSDTPTTPELDWSTPESVRAWASWAQGRIVDLEGERDDVLEEHESLLTRLCALLPVDYEDTGQCVEDDLIGYFAALTPTKEDE